MLLFLTTKEDGTGNKKVRARDFPGAVYSLNTRVLPSRRCSADARKPSLPPFLPSSTSTLLRLSPTWPNDRRLWPSSIRHQRAGFISPPPPLLPPHNQLRRPRSHDWRDMRRWVMWQTAPRRCQVVSSQDAVKLLLRRRPCVPLHRRRSTLSTRIS